VVRRHPTGRGNAAQFRGARVRTGLGFAAILAIVTALAVAVVGTTSAGAVVLPVNGFGFEGSEAGQLTHPGSVAIDPASGNVFVADTGNNRIDEFTSEGFFLRAWGWGVKDGTSTLQTCQAEVVEEAEIPAECHAGQPGQGAGQLNEPVAVAFSPNGDLYALNRARGDGRVMRFSLAGGKATFVESFGGYGEGEEHFSYEVPQTDSLAIGPSGDVYVVDSVPGRVAIFSEDGAYEGEFTGPSAETAIAVDPAGGNVFVAGISGVEEFEADGTPIGAEGTFLGGYGTLAIGFNGNNGRVVLETTKGFGPTLEYLLDEYEETGSGYAKVESSPVPGMAIQKSESEPKSYGLAFDPAAAYEGSTPGAFFLSDYPGGRITVVAEPVPGAPEASGIAASAVGSDGANLLATIDPHGSDTHYFFRYGTTAAYGQVAPALPGVDLGAGFAARKVSTHLVGLAPGTTYHFQLVAQNALGSFEGEDQIFTTVGAGSPQGLPDGRAYEQVSTAKGINDIGSENPYLAVEGFAEAGGDGVTFSAINGLPGSASGILYTVYGAHRGADGWTMQGASAPEENLTSLATARNELVSPDLKYTVALSAQNITGNAPAGFSSLYLRNNSTGTEELMTPYPDLNHQAFVFYTMFGASSDFRHILFETSAALTPDTPTSSTYNLYEFSNGQLRNVGILPGQTAPSPEGLASAARNRAPYPVSEDGSRVFFVANKPPVGGEFSGPQLYLRTNDASTVEISASQRRPAEAGPAGQVTFVGAAANGSSAFFLSNSELTDDAYTGDPPGGAPNLYRYDVASGKLTDLTVTSSGPDEQFGANVGGVVISKDGDSAYFTARGVLAPGATFGATNLYHWTLGQPLRYVAELNEFDPLATESGGPQGVSRLTPDGSVIAFNSSKALDPAHPEVEGTYEIYRYAAGGAVTCVSCGRPGSTPSEAAIAPAFYAAAPPNNVMSSDGSRIFFGTEAALVPQDNDGKADVYEWEGGQVQLISNGSGAYPSRLIDASESGNDVFFQTRDQLVPTDTDENVDVYDARVGGGFPLPATASPPCEAEACRPPAEAAPPASQIGSRTFVGPTNKKAAKKKHKPRHKKKHHKKKAGHHKKKHRKHHKKHSNGKRG
jgi:hypothetical protein